MQIEEIQKLTQEEAKAVRIAHKWLSNTRSVDHFFSHDQRGFKWQAICGRWMYLYPGPITGVTRCPECLEKFNMLLHQEEGENDEALHV